MNESKLGAIGYGFRGNIADIGCRDEFNSRVVALAELRESQRKKFKEKYPDADVCMDYHELLKRKDLDAIFCLTPDFSHEEIGIEILEAGIPLYLEKPMAITIEGCDRLLKTAMRTGTKLFVGHNMRHFPGIMKMKKIIDSGIIGDIECAWCRHFVNYGGDAYFRDWHSECRNTTGLLLQKGAHDIDVIHWLADSYTTLVSGMGKLSVYNRCKRRPPEIDPDIRWNDGQWPPWEENGFSQVIDVEDHNMVMMQMANGVQATYLQCHYTPDAERNYTFIGTKGRIENIGDMGKAEIHVWTQRGSRSTPDIIYHIKDEGGYGYGHGGADVRIVRNFIDFIRMDAKTNTSPVAARNAVAVGVLGHQSMRNDCGGLQIPPLSEELIRYFENNQKK